ncbi:MAG: hypothetical protein IPM56_08140 [Ignavibacteriales bacterium]|nr:MAG: hypothetical protein IPM56_08140 [Ignavibacteriales bacterium]
MNNKYEEIIDPEEFLYWVRLSGEKKSSADNDENQNLLKIIRNDSNLEWRQEYELIYKSHKLEIY